MLGARAEYLRHPVRSFPLIARRHTTDHRVFAQIFVEQEYTPVDDWNNVEVVVDCGANVGYSSAYFLTAFPESRVIAVEPDPENYRVLTRNLEPYGARAVALHAALWSRPGQVELRSRTIGAEAPGAGRWANRPAGDQNRWRRSTSHRSWNDSTCRAFHCSRWTSKNETVVFSERTSEWLPRVDALVVELHDDSILARRRRFFQRASPGI